MCVCVCLCACMRECVFVYKLVIALTQDKNNVVDVYNITNNRKLP